MSAGSIHAPGWDAIDRWVNGKFPAQTPHQFTSKAPYELDKPSPLPAITVWSTRSPPGWLYVTYGLSELFEKSSDDPDVSGFGFELSLRLPMTLTESEGDETPPVWPLRLLQSLGHHVLSTRKGFDSGHAMNLGGSIVPPNTDGPRESVLAGLVCLPDPALGKVTTINGTLLFLRLFGVTTDELEVLGELELGSLVACIAELEPLAITDPSRGSFLADPQKARILRRYKVGIVL
ncbi:suppressor of fused domain protein [Nannocystaceae bacterium ST9]